MKPCCNRNHTDRPSAQAAQTVQNAAVNRYSHPIRTRNITGTGSVEELLSYILETLSHHSDLLEELLRRTSPDSSDTR